MIKPEWIPSAYADADKKIQQVAVRKENSKLRLVKYAIKAGGAKSNK